MNRIILIGNGFDMEQLQYSCTTELDEVDWKSRYLRKRAGRLSGTISASGLYFVEQKRQ